MFPDLSCNSLEDSPIGASVLNPHWPLFILRLSSAQWCGFICGFLHFLFVCLTLHTSCIRQMWWPLRAARLPGSTLSWGFSLVCRSRRGSLMSGNAEQRVGSDHEPSQFFIKDKPERCTFLNLYSFRKLSSYWTCFLLLVHERNCCHSCAVSHSVMFTFSF